MIDLTSIKQTLKKLEELKAKAGIILGRMRLALKTLLTKYKPVPLDRNGITTLVQRCKTESKDLSRSKFLQRSGLWTWCFECFDLTLVELKSGLNFQEILSLLAYLIRGYTYLIDSIDDLICKIITQSRLSII